MSSLREQSNCCGKDEATIDIGSHVLALRIGWPIILVLALMCHVIDRRGNSKSKEDS